MYLSKYILALALLVAAGSAHAQLALGLTPAGIDFQVGPGQSAAQAITVTNAGTIRCQGRMLSNDWWYSDTERKVFGTPGSQPRSAGRWLSFSPDKFELDPGQSILVRVTITVPSDAEGGHYAVAFAEFAPPQPKGGQAVVFGGRVGALITQIPPGTPNGPDKTIKLAGAIEKLEIVPPTRTQPLRAIAQVKNNGNVHMDAQGTLVLVDKQHRLIGNTTVPRQRLLPGQKGHFEASWTGKMKPGMYEALFTVTYGEENADVKRMAVPILPSSP
jgi:hypothetical protein